MMNIYRTIDETGLFKEQNNIEKGCWINLINPTNQEINTLVQSIGVREDFLRYPLDQEERARIDSEDDQLLILIDMPTIEKSENFDGFSTVPIGMIVVKDDYFITVSTIETPILQSFIECKIKGFFTFKKTRFILQILFQISISYLNCLKSINKAKDKAEESLKKSMRNQELIRMLELEKSLVYFTTSLKANEIVMEKLTRTKFIKMYDEDEDILEDAIVENRQAIEMGTIYRDILSGTMDAYASVISNNLNIVMKFLAAFTIVLSIPTIVSGLWGMNIINLPFANNPIGFWIVLGITLATSIGSCAWLKKKNMF